jgi:membrane-associated phospholipid phosphatase
VASSIHVRLSARARFAFAFVLTLAFASPAAAEESARPTAGESSASGESAEETAPGPPAIDLLARPPSALADGPASTWSPPYRPETSTADLVLTGAAVAISLGGAVASPNPRHFRGGLLFDEDVRDALRVRSTSGRYAVRDTSDVGLSLEATWPFLVDALITAWWYRGNDEIARRMALVDAEAFAIIGAVHGVTNNAASRERPYGRECGVGLPSESVDCQGNVRYRSFFSGHAAISFTGASLVCVHHVGLGLLGPPGDALSCVGGYAVAAATTTFRVMADMHYATDVLTGALVGTAVGLGIPLLRRSRVDGADRTNGVRMQIVPVGTGLGVGGVF